MLTSFPSTVESGRERFSAQVCEWSEKMWGDGQEIECVTPCLCKLSKLGFTALQKYVYHDLFLLNRVCGKGNQESQHLDCGHRRKPRGAVSPGHDWSGGNLLSVITVIKFLFHLLLLLYCRVTLRVQKELFKYNYYYY